LQLDNVHIDIKFQHTAARRRLDDDVYRPYVHIGFNTQPPEGGCALCQWDSRTQNSFNTQPPEGGCQHNALALIVQTCVSTHSRPKAAVLRDKLTCGHSGFQHTAARRRLYQSGRVLSAGIVSTHSRPKAAVSPRFEAGCKGWFQHTAARRRLLSR